jgi:lysophospholipase L1-like esterase
MTAIAMALLLAQGNDQARANSYDDGWEAAWVARSLALYTTTGKSAGKVLQVGDSITYSNPYSQWPRGGSGKTAEDTAVLAWCHGADWDFSATANLSIQNGWYLAAFDAVPGSRGMTAASGLDTAELLSGDGNPSGSAMPATSNTATAQAYVSGGSYGGNLHVTTVASAFADAQFAVVMLGTNDCSAGRSTTAFLADLASVVDALEARSIVVVLSTIPPHYANDALAQGYNAGIRNLAQARGLALIDLYAEILARRPGTSWNGTLLGLDDVHPTASGGGYNASSNPYSPGGDPATHTTGDACLSVGYLLRSWLAVQKLKEVRSYVVLGASPPAPPPGGGSSSGSGGGCGATGLEVALLLILLRRR